MASDVKQVFITIKERDKPHKVRLDHLPRPVWPFNGLADGNHQGNCILHACCRCAASTSQ